MPVTLWSTLAFACAAAVLGWGVLANPKQASSPAANEPYVYVPATGCPAAPRDLAADLAARTPREAAYPVCVDQVVLYESEVRAAAAEGRMLVVEFGATWCPWCKVLDTALADVAVVRGGDPGGLDLSKAYRRVKIGVSTLSGGRRAAIPSGDALLTRLKSAAGGPEMRAVPFLILVDPRTPERIVARNTDDLHDLGSGAFDHARLRAVLVEAHAHLASGAGAPAEPGWLARKWQRLISRF